jgi:predicted glycosyltransferase involved in capsule biosynthesis
MDKKIVFISHKAYHTRNMAEVAKHISKYNYVFLHLGKYHFKEGAKEEMDRLDLDYIEYMPSLFSKTKPLAIVTMCDWDKTVRSLVRRMKREGIPTIALIEGVQDYEDSHIGHIAKGCKRNPYRTVEYPLLIGEYDRKFIKTNKAKVVGCPRLDKLFEEKPTYPDKPVVLINSNFTYELYTDYENEWIDGIVEVCKELGVDYQISVHPQDNMDFTGYKVYDGGLYDAIRGSTMLVSRFSTAILECMAMGKPVIYYNPHGERQDTFQDPMGGYDYTTNKEQLKEAIKKLLYYRGDYKEQCKAFMDYHLYRPEDMPSSKLTALTIEDIISEHLIHKERERNIQSDIYQLIVNKQIDRLIEYVSDYENETAKIVLPHRLFLYGHFLCAKFFGEYYQMKEKDGRNKTNKIIMLHAKNKASAYLTDYMYRNENHITNIDRFYASMGLVEFVSGFIGGILSHGLWIEFKDDFDMLYMLYMQMRRLKFFTKKEHLDFLHYIVENYKEYSDKHIINSYLYLIRRLQGNKAYIKKLYYLMFYHPNPVYNKEYSFLKLKLSRYIRFIFHIGGKVLNKIGFLFQRLFKIKPKPDPKTIGGVGKIKRQIKQIYKKDKHKHKYLNSESLSINELSKYINGMSSELDNHKIYNSKRGLYPSIKSERIDSLNNQNRIYNKTDSQGIKLSVIIAYRNRKELTNICLNNLCLQTLDNDLFEVIIVDLGSEKEHQINPEQYPIDINYQYVDYKDQFYKTMALNIGVGKAKGEYLFFLDAEILLHRHFLENAFNMVKDKPKGFALNFPALYLASDISAKVMKEGFMSDVVYDAIYTLRYDQKVNIRSPRIFGQFMIIMKKEFFHDIGGFDEDFKGFGWEDYDFHNRIALFNHDWHYELEQFKMMLNKMMVIHLYHPRLEKSGYFANYQFNKDMYNIKRYSKYVDVEVSFNMD